MFSRSWFPTEPSMRNWNHAGRSGFSYFYSTVDYQLYRYIVFNLSGFSVVAQLFIGVSFLLRNQGCTFRSTFPLWIQHAAVVLELHFVC